MTNKIQQLLYILVIVIIILQINIINGQVGNLCTNCLKIGEKCNSLGSCKGDSVCSSETKYFNQDPKCLVAKELSDKCHNDEQCRLGLKCKIELNNENGICSNIKFAQVNEKCETDYDCSGNNIAKCINGVCTRTNENGGVVSKDGIGNSCSFSNPCDFGQYCQYTNKTCQPQLEQGDTCLQSIQCKVGHFCDVASNTCKKVFSLGKGDKCSTYSLDQCNSNKDLYCTSSSICEELDVNNHGECLLMENLCSPFHTCSCSDFKCHPNRQFGKNFTKALKDLYKCQSVHKCQFTNNRFSNSSCLTKHCGQQFCDFNLALSPSFDNPLNCERTPVRNYCSMVDQLLQQKQINIYINDHGDDDGNNDTTTNTTTTKRKLFLNHSKDDLIFYSFSIPFLILIFSIVVEIKLHRCERLKSKFSNKLTNKI